MELLGLACGFPMLFEQMYFDLEALLEERESQKAPTWRRKGEKAVDARDRLRAEREAAKARLGVA
jgi:hypothetical protein